MNYKFAKVVLPVVLAVGSLGLGTIATTSASASTKVHHAAKAHAAVKAHPAVKATVSLTGSVVKVNITKGAFWFKVGAKTYRASFTSATTFKKGTSASLVKGAIVSVTGKYAGKSSSVVIASSITA